MLRMGAVKAAQLEPDRVGSQVRDDPADLLGSILGAVSGDVRVGDEYEAMFVAGPDRRPQPGGERAGEKLPAGERSEVDGHERQKVPLRPN